MPIKFFKMSGAGNDFVLTENKNYTDSQLKKMAVAFCNRRLSIGADGLLAVYKIDNKSISMRYFNSDGSEAFCGNGSRCSVWWAYKKGLCNAKTMLVSIAGSLQAEVIKDECVKMQMPDVKNIDFNIGEKLGYKNTQAYFLNTGVPHCVIPVSLEQLKNMDLDSDGKKIRNAECFSPEGTNVDFIAIDDSSGESIVKVRTYERGVESETLACGTGITACAISVGIKNNLKSPVCLQSACGDKFCVSFNKDKDGVNNVYVEGLAKIVFEGEINV